MSSPTRNPATIEVAPDIVNDAQSRAEVRLPPLLSVIAGMVDLTGFYNLGHIFTAHVTGNLVVAAGAAVHGGPFNRAQLLAIPVYMLAVAATWLIAKVSHRDGTSLARLLLVVQSVLLAGLLIFCVTTKPSDDPFGVAAGVAVLIAVSAMACQFALLRLALPHAGSTAVMTGNVTNFVLSLMDLLSKGRASPPADANRVKKSLNLLVGFLFGCVVAAVVVPVLRDWTWTLPAVLSGVAIAFCPSPSGSTQAGGAVTDEPIRRAPERDQCLD
ncbi:YoaK family protein [Mesorhizobium sp. 43Arga]